MAFPFLSVATSSFWIPPFNSSSSTISRPSRPLSSVPTKPSLDSSTKLRPSKFLSSINWATAFDFSGSIIRSIHTNAVSSCNDFTMSSFDIVTYGTISSAIPLGDCLIILGSAYRDFVTTLIANGLPLRS